MESILYHYLACYATVGLVCIFYYLACFTRLFGCQSLRKSYINRMSTDSGIKETPEGDIALDAVFKAQNPTVVFVTGENCGPCKMMKPLFMKIGGLYGDKVDFVYLDAHDNAKYLKSIEVNRIPVTFFVKSGEIQHRIIGQAPESAFHSSIQGHLLRPSQPMEAIDFSL